MPNTRDNPAETVLTRANVVHLVSAFSTRVNPNNPQISGVYPDPIVAVASSICRTRVTGSLKRSMVQPAPSSGGPRLNCYGGTTETGIRRGQIWLMQDVQVISAISTGGVQISCIPLFNAVGYNTSPPSAGNGTVYG